MLRYTLAHPPIAFGRGQPTAGSRGSRRSTTNFPLRRPAAPARTTAAAPPLPPLPSRRRATARFRLSRAVSPLIAAPPPSVSPDRRASSPSPATRVRRGEEPQLADPGVSSIRTASEGRRSRSICHS